MKMIKEINSERILLALIAASWPPGLIVYAASFLVYQVGDRAGTALPYFIYGFAIFLTVTFFGSIALYFLKDWSATKRSEDRPAEINAEFDNHNTELQAHRDLFKSLYQYVGSYPVWKVQQEFRELVLELNPGIDHCNFHFHNLDAYFTKLVNEMDKLRQYHDSHYSLGHGWGDALPQARGDHLLPKIVAKHTQFIKRD